MLGREPEPTFARELTLISTLQLKMQNEIIEKHLPVGWQWVELLYSQ